MDMTVVVVLVVLGILLIGAGMILTWRRGSVRSAAGLRRAPRSSPSKSEFTASASSEAVEQLVNQRLADIPGLAGTRVDFGTGADGSLVIWVGEARYSAVDEIGDDRIRQAVQDAVAAFNQ